MRSPNSGLSIGIALPPTGLGRARQLLLGSLPFLALDRRVAGPVLGIPLDGGSGPRAWPELGNLAQTDESPQCSPAPFVLAAQQATAPSASPELGLGFAASGQDRSAAVDEPRPLGFVGADGLQSEAVSPGARSTLAEAGTGDRSPLPSVGPESRTAQASIVGRVAASLGPGKPPQSEVSDAAHSERPAGVAFASGHALLGLLPALALFGEGAAPDRGPMLPQRDAAKLIVADLEPAPLSGRRLPLRQEGVVIARAFDAAVGSLDGRVKQEVEMALERRNAAERQGDGAAAETGGKHLAESPQDRTMRALRQKMRDLDREDRFRSGLLR